MGAPIGGSVPPAPWSPYDQYVPKLWEPPPPLKWVERHPHQAAAVAIGIFAVIWAMAWLIIIA